MGEGSKRGKVKIGKCLSQYTHSLALCTQIRQLYISYTMIVVYSRDHKGVGVAHEVISSKKQPQFPLTTIRQYWLGKTKPKQAFRFDLKCFQQVATKF